MGESTNFGDAEKNEKFRKLMGIKSTAPPAVVAEQCVAAPSRVLSNEEQDRMQDNLEQQYELGRQQTHKNKGLGLGFSGGDPFAAYNTPAPSSNPLAMAGFVRKHQ